MSYEHKVRIIPLAEQPVVDVLNAEAKDGWEHLFNQIVPIQSSPIAGPQQYTGPGLMLVLRRPLKPKIRDLLESRKSAEFTT